MKTLRVIGCAGLIGLLLGACGWFVQTLLFQTQKNGENTAVVQTPAVVKTGTPTLDISKRRVEELGGSRSEGATVSNADGSLACSLKNWSLIGVFEDDKLSTTEGEFVFKITNRGQSSQKFVLAELLISDKEGKVVTLSNPFRKLQGQRLKLNPPLKSGHTRDVKRLWKYATGWYTVKLKTCRWLAASSQYFEIYPELKDYPMP